MSAQNPNHKQRQLDLAQERGPMLRVAALLVLLIASVPQAKAEPPDEQAWRLLNHYRQLAGLTPVKLDQKLSAGCMGHAIYMVQNQGTDAMAGLNPHTQRPNLPGASAAGAACAKAADLFPGVSDLGVAIEAWMAGMYHRRPMLDPQLERIGVGYARLPDGMLMAALRFENTTLRRGGWPVAYPADNQTDVPLEYGTEFPNPIPNHGTGGYAITLQFPPFDKVTGVSAKLTEVSGKSVEFFLSDPEQPATSFGQFGVICLIPKQSLQAQHAYTVRIDATGKANRVAGHGASQRSRCARSKPRMIAPSPARSTLRAWSTAQSPTAA